MVLESGASHRTLLSISDAYEVLQRCTEENWAGGRGKVTILRNDYLNFSLCLSGTDTQREITYGIHHLY